MKFLKQIRYGIVALIIFMSCSPSFYYQVYKVEHDQNIEKKTKKLVYNDDYCTVEYNLWDASGNIGFKLINKTNNFIYINLEESFFILNGIAYPYFLNRTFETYTETSTIKTSESKHIIIPPNSARIIAEYLINDKYLSDKELRKYPKNNDTSSKKYDKSNSPLIFSNYIVYYFGNNMEQKIFTNSFFVSEITNYPSSQAFEYKTDENGNNAKVKTFKAKSPDSFYNKYGIYTGIEIE